MASTRSVLSRSELSTLVEAHKHMPCYNWMPTALSYYGTTRIKGAKNNQDIIRFISSGLGCYVEPVKMPPLSMNQMIQKVLTEPSQAYSAFGINLLVEYSPNRKCKKNEKEIMKDETAWCAAFVNHIMKSCGYDGTVGDKRLSARSWLNWGKPIESKDANFGDIIVVNRPGGPGSGHVGFFVQKKGGKYQIFGGNQSTKSWVCVRNYPESLLLGFRQPN